MPLPEENAAVFKKHHAKPNADSRFLFAHSCYFNRGPV
jgi:hypothetical protein